MKYCKYCGRQLQEDEMCTCEDAVRERDFVNSDNELTTNRNPFAPIDTESTISPETSDSMAATPVTSETPAPSDASMEQKIPTNITFDTAFQGAEHSETSQGAVGQEGAGTSSFKKKHVAGAVLKTAFQNVIPFLKAFVKAPANAICACADNTDLPLSGIFYAVYVLSLILCEVCGISRIMKLFAGINSFFYLFGTSGIKVSYLWVIISALLLAIVILVITLITLLVIKLCFHSKYSFKQIVAGASPIFVYPAISYLLAAIFMFISVPLAICILVIGNISYLIMTYYTIKSLFHKNDNSPFLLTTIIIIASLSIFTTLAAMKVTFSFADNIVKSQTTSNIDITNDYNDYNDYFDYFDYFN